MGKTEFLMHDFMPAAQAQGYACAYVNLWELQNDPAVALVFALHKASRPGSFAKMWAGVNTPISSIKASGKFAGAADASVEVALEDRNTATGTMLVNVMSEFDKTRKKMVLIIDEAQVLASADNSVFAHALRAALDLRRERLKVLFAGSSETTLRRMFGRASEPFYNWAALEPFPLLGREFVESLVKKVALVSRLPLSIKDAMEAFDALKQTPLFFREYLDRYLTHPFEGVQKALAVTRAKVFSDAGFEKQWDSLLPTDQLLLRLIAHDTADLQSMVTRKRVGADLGLEKPVTAAALQNSLRRMTNRNVITRMDRGAYRVEDEAFAEWLRHPG